MFRPVLAGLVLAFAASTASEAATLFDQLGSKPGMERLVERSTAVWLADPRIGHTFDDTNIERFKGHLYEQLCQVTDGGCNYTGQTMKDAHKGLHLRTTDFNILVEDMQVAMDQIDIPFSVQNKLLARLAPMYRDVVTK